MDRSVLCNYSCQSHNLITNRSLDGRVWGQSKMREVMLVTQHITFSLSFANSPIFFMMKDCLTAVHKPLVKPISEDRTLSFLFLAQVLSWHQTPCIPLRRRSCSSTAVVIRAVASGSSHQLSSRPCQASILRLGTP